MNILGTLDIFDILNILNISNTFKLLKNKIKPTLIALLKYQMPLLLSTQGPRLPISSHNMSFSHIQPRTQTIRSFPAPK